MKIYVVSCFDAAAAVYGRPAFYASTGLAVRSFSDEVNRSSADNALFNHPEDFTLYRLGVFDDVLGKFDGADCPVRLTTANDVKVRS